MSIESAIPKENWENVNSVINSETVDKLKKTELDQNMHDEQKILLLIKLMLEQELNDQMIETEEFKFHFGQTFLHLTDAHKTFLVQNMIETNRSYEQNEISAVTEVIVQFLNTLSVPKVKTIFESILASNFIDENIKIVLFLCALLIPRYDLRNELFVITSKTKFSLDSLKIISKFLLF